MQKISSREIKLFIFGSLAAYAVLCAAAFAVYAYADSSGRISSSSALKSESSDESNSTSQENETGSNPPGNEAFPGFPEASSEQTSLSPAESTVEHPASDYFLIEDASSGEILTVTAEDFIPGAVACEMDLSFPEEALKAQAAACYTVYSYKRMNSRSKGLESDFSCDSANWLVYTTEEHMREKFGENYDEDISILNSAAEAVNGKILLYDGKPICATYFLSSCGATQSSGDVWGKEFSYLIPVSSPWDSLYENSVHSAAFSQEEVKELMTTAFSQKNFDFSSDGDTWFSQPELNASGYVKSVLFCGETLSGSEVKNTLSLASPAFEIDFSDGNFIFVTKGRGHGVGMSQVGAAYMAQAGFGYEQILQHYYHGASLSEVQAFY